MHELGSAHMIQSGLTVKTSVLLIYNSRTSSISADENVYCKTTTKQLEYDYRMIHVDENMVNG